MLAWAARHPHLQIWVTALPCADLRRDRRSILGWPIPDDCARRRRAARLQRRLPKAVRMQILAANIHAKRDIGSCLAPALLRRGSFLTRSPSSLRAKRSS